MVSTDPRVDKIYTDMYLGEGRDNPSMTIRVDRLEKCTEEMVANSRSTRTMMIGTMITVLGSVITAFICYRLGIKL